MRWKRDTTTTPKLSVLVLPFVDIAQQGPASPRELTEALELPKSTDARVHELATQLGQGTSSPERRLRRTVSYFQNEYHYALKVGNFRTSQPVAEFLFEKKQGYCEYFAGAAAVLLRLEGVSTR